MEKLNGRLEKDAIWTKQDTALFLYDSKYDYVGENWHLRDMLERPFVL